MSTALMPVTAAQLERVPRVPWRDPASVPRADLDAHIARLEDACLADPRSADLRTSLGMAYAIRLDVYKSMDALEAARQLEPDHFWAQLKYAELHFRLRALLVAQDETRKAIELAGNPWELSLARKQLQEIRALLSTSTRNVPWSGPLWPTALVVAGFVVSLVTALWWMR